jgi:hypothetical protein
MADGNMMLEHICKSCGNSFHGLYCNLCGEKVILPRDRQIGAAMSKVLIATTFNDNKFIHSLWLTISNPGFLSRQYVDGRRVMYMRPLQMFFILNVVYFFFPVLQMFNASLYTQLNVLPHSTLAREIVFKKIQLEGMSMKGFELIYNNKTVGLAKLLIVIFVVLAALPLSLIFRRRNRYVSDHLALSIELTSFNLAVNAIGLTLVFWVISKLFQVSHAGSASYLNDLTLTIIFVSTNLYFIMYAGRTFYNQKGKRLIFKALGGIIGLFLALEAYRLILFFITIWLL